jgi:hypothetical protein
MSPCRLTTVATRASPLESLCLELHARRDLVAAERSTRHLLDELLVALAVTVGRRNLDVELVARRLALELLLEPRDDVPVTVNVGEGLATRRAVEHLAVVVRERVMNRDDLVRSDDHRYSLSIPESCAAGKPTRTFRPAALP